MLGLKLLQRRLVVVDQREASRPSATCAHATRPRTTSAARAIVATCCVTCCVWRVRSNGRGAAAANNGADGAVHDQRGGAHHAAPRHKNRTEGRLQTEYRNVLHVALVQLQVNTRTKPVTTAQRRARRRRVARATRGTALHHPSNPIHEQDHAAGGAHTTRGDGHKPWPAQPGWPPSSRRQGRGGPPPEAARTRARETSVTHSRQGKACSAMGHDTPCARRQAAIGALR